jgi:hypothetical protein
MLIINFISILFSLWLILLQEAKATPLRRNESQAATEITMANTNFLLAALGTRSCGQCAVFTYPPSLPFTLPPSPVSLLAARQSGSEQNLAHRAPFDWQKAYDDGVKFWDSATLQNIDRQLDSQANTLQIRSPDGSTGSYPQQYDPETMNCLDDGSVFQL